MPNENDKKHGLTVGDARYPPPGTEIPLWVRGQEKNGWREKYLIVVIQSISVDVSAGIDKTPWLWYLVVSVTLEYRT